MKYREKKWIKTKAFSPIKWLYKNGFIMAVISQNKQNNYHWLIHDGFDNIIESGYLNATITECKREIQKRISTIKRE